jgi:putative toxin-antitoxin system antitoxin component (TIGR02293 family)
MRTSKRSKPGVVSDSGSVPFDDTPFARLLSLAVVTLESDENARAWLASPQVGLGGAIPLEMARTEEGAREVEDLLGRIEHGVYS